MSVEHRMACTKADPIKVADVVLSAAVRAGADAVFIEPAPIQENAYVMVFERGSSLITTVTVEATLGAAVVARLAYLAELDLAASSPSTAVLPVTTGTASGDVVVTLRPGDSLRADLMVLPRQRERWSPDEPRELVAGDVVDHYRILEGLGAGGMGVVYRVEHVALGRVLALKVLSGPAIHKTPNAAQQFLREARAAARVRHPHIAEVFDFGQLPDGRPYFVMELVQGERLADRVTAGPMKVADVVTIARQLAGALATAHDRGVIHADVTPANVLVTDDGGLHTKLIDFGLAQLAGERLTDDTSSSYVFGTPEYISPEQLRGVSASDRSDQYGLGCVLFEMLTGHPPYQHEDLNTLLRMHINAPIPVVESPHGPIPPRLAEVITTCLQKVPQARFPGMRALLAALDDVERVTARRGWRQWLAS
jgi:serine/threonine protein kinase